jgi:hypothetical protein
MKTRMRHVSNSSSSSFIITFSNILEVAASMFKARNDEYNEWDNCTLEDIQKRDACLVTLESLCHRDDVISGQYGVYFKSCNYDTYILYHKGKILVDTCNNHDWNSCWLENMGVEYVCDDYNEDDSENEMFKIMNATAYYAVEGDQPLINKDEQIPHENDDQTLLCPECKGSYHGDPVLYYIPDINDIKYCPSHLIRLVKKEVLDENKNGIRK